MNPITLSFVFAVGVWFFQDALASIAYYPQEKWKWNHAARIIRVGLALALMIISGIGLAGL